MYYCKYKKIRQNKHLTKTKEFLINTIVIPAYSYVRDVTTGATGATEVAPKFSDTLTLFQPGGQILPTIAEVEPKFSP